MTDPIVTFLNALFLILRKLPLPFMYLVGVVAVFSFVMIVVKIVRGL